MRSFFSFSAQPRSFKIFCTCLFTYIWKSEAELKEPEAEIDDPDPDEPDTDGPDADKPEADADFRDKEAFPAEEVDGEIEE